MEIIQCCDRFTASIMSKLLCFLLVVAAASACQYAPGSTVTTTTKTVTTVSSSGGAGGEGVGGVSAGERELIRSTWNQAKKDGDVAPTILLRFLKAHPELQSKFSSFASVPINELRHNGNFLAQAFTILAGLNVVIQASGSQELIAQELAQLGVAHFKRGVSVAQFEQFARVIVDVLEEEVNLSAEAKSAWEKGLTAIIAGIAQSLKKEEDVTHPLTHLTPHQIADVRRTWENLRADRNAIVSEIFIKLLSDDATLLKKFATFSNVDVNDLPTNADYNKQIALVADRLDNMIATADNTLQILGQIQYMGHSHKPRNVGRATFEAFARLLYKKLSARGVSADDLESWKGVLTVLVNGIAKVQGL